MRSRGPSLLVAYLVGIVILGTNAPSPLYVIYQQRFHFSSLTLTAVFGVYALAVLFALLVVGRASDALGRRAVLMPGLALLTLGTILFACAQDVEWLFAARLVQGLATGTLMPAATASLIDLDPGPDGRRGSQRAVLAFLAGASIGPLLAGAMAQYLPHPTVLPFVAVGVLDVAGVVGLAVLPDGSLQRGAGERLRIQRPSVPDDIRQAFGLAAAVVAMAWALGGLYAGLGPSMVRQVLHQDNHVAAGAILFLFNVAAGGCQLLCRRADSRQLMRRGIVIMVAGITLVQVAFAGRWSAVFLVATVVAGAGQGLCYVSSATLLNRVAPPQRRAEINTAYNVAAYLALSLPAVGVGVLTTVMSLHAASLIFSALVAVVAVPCLFLVARPLPDERSALTASIV